MAALIAVFTMDLFMNASSAQPLGQSDTNSARFPSSARPGYHPNQPFQHHRDKGQPAGFIDALFDTTGLGTVPNIPLISTAILKAHHAFIETDTRFRAAARMLQALWRVDRDLPIGVHISPNGKRRKLGSRTSTSAGRLGGNFMSPAIARLVERELVYRELGAVIEEDRLRHNLLSSQPLCFNLFGPLKLDLGLATAVFDQILPGFIKDVVDVRFEHSPARGHSSFTADGTAFDLLVRGYTAAGRRAFVAIEVKYSEGGNEPLPRFSGRFDDIARSSDLFIDPDDPALRSHPVQQLFRQSCLATAMLDRELYDEGVHLFIAPSDNHLAQNAASAYALHLKNPEAGRLPFVPVTLEGLIGAIGMAGERDHARALHRRYCDWWLLDKELQLEPNPSQMPGDFADPHANPAADSETTNGAIEAH